MAPAQRTASGTKRKQDGSPSELTDDASTSWSRKKVKTEREDRNGVGVGGKGDTVLWKLYQLVEGAQDDSGREIALDFIKLPSKKLYPDYYRFTKHPISLSKIRSFIENGKYVSSDEGTALDALKQDFMTMVGNAKKYNVKGSGIWDDAVSIQKIVKDYQAPAPPFRITFRQQAAPPPPAPPTNPSEVQLSILQHLESLTEPRTKRQYTEIFQELPSKRDYAIYYRVIDRPRSLGQIKDKLTKGGGYKSWSEFEDDVELVWENAFSFNEDSSGVFHDAKYLQKEFKEKLAEKRKEFGIVDEEEKNSALKLKLNMGGSQHPQSTPTATPGSAPSTKIKLAVPKKEKSSPKLPNTTFSPPETIKPTPVRPSTIQEGPGPSASAALAQRLLGLPLPAPLPVSHTPTPPIFQPGFASQHLSRSSSPLKQSHTPPTPPQPATSQSPNNTPPVLRPALPRIASAGQSPLQPLSGTTFGLGLTMQEGGINGEWSKEWARVQATTNNVTTSSLQKAVVPIQSPKEKTTILIPLMTLSSEEDKYLLSVPGTRQQRPPLSLTRPRHGMTSLVLSLWLSREVSLGGIGTYEVTVQLNGRKVTPFVGGNKSLAAGSITVQPRQANGDAIVGDHKGDEWRYELEFSGETRGIWVVQVDVRVFKGRSVGGGGRDEETEKIVVFVR